MNLVQRVMHFDMDEHFSEIEKVVSQFSYKPGWKFQVTKQFDDILFEANVSSFTPHPMSSAEVLNATSFTVNFKLTMSHLQFADDLEQETLNCIRLLIRSSELHEMDEWCEYQGERRWNQH